MTYFVNHHTKKNVYVYKKENHYKLKKIYTRKNEDVRFFVEGISNRGSMMASGK